MSNNTENATQTGKENEIGALWSKTSKSSGSEYFSGHLTGENGEKVKIVVFRNSYKKAGENTPDMRIYKSQPLSEQNQSPSSGGQVAKSSTSKKQAQVQENLEDEEIPF